MTNQVLSRAARDRAAALQEARRALVGVYNSRAPSTDELASLAAFVIDGTPPLTMLDAPDWPPPAPPRPSRLGRLAEWTTFAGVVAVWLMTLYLDLKLAWATVLLLGVVAAHLATIARVLLDAGRAYEPETGEEGQ